MTRSTGRKYVQAPTKLLFFFVISRIAKMFSTIIRKSNSNIPRAGRIGAPGGAVERAEKD